MGKHTPEKSPRLETFDTVLTTVSRKLFYQTPILCYVSFILI